MYRVAGSISTEPHLFSSYAIDIVTYNICLGGYLVIIIPDYFDHSCSIIMELYTEYHATSNLFWPEFQGSDLDEKLAEL